LEGKPVASDKELEGKPVPDNNDYGYWVSLNFIIRVCSCVHGLSFVLFLKMIWIICMKCL
jgi:hypothetical protein